MRRSTCAILRTTQEWVGQLPYRKSGAKQGGFPMRLRPVSSLRLFVLGLMPLLAVACTDEKIVYREPFNPPPDAEAGFVGYFTTSDKSTTCGNCHVDHENKWVETAHADAYAGLVESGGAQDFCYGCHTVSENGNAVSEPAG